MDEVDSLLQQAIVYRDQVFERIEAGEHDEAYQIMKTYYIPLLDQMANTLQDIADVAGENALHMVEDGEHAQTSAMVTIILIIALSILLAILFGLYISNGIRRPVDLSLIHIYGICHHTYHIFDWRGIRCRHELLEYHIPSPDAHERDGLRH